jgi:hypothetical protein
VFEQVDWLLGFQITECGRGIGGFARNGKQPGYSSLVYTEAVLRAAQLALRRGEYDRFVRYRSASIAGLQFCSELRLVREQEVFFPFSKRCIGGITTSLTNFVVRSDMVQHAITMIGAALEVPEVLS